MDMNPIEAAWRRFRKSDDWELYTRSREECQRFLDVIGLKRCPPEVVLPLAVPFNLRAMQEAQARGERIGTRMSFEGSLLCNTIHVWAAYRADKTIYEVEPLLADCLARSPWPEATPVAALRLPSRCPVLSISRGEAAVYLATAYDLLTGGEQTGGLELRISQYDGEMWVPISVLHLTGSSLRECVDAAAAEARVHGAPDDAAAQWLNPAAGLALTLLLYLSGDPDVVRIVHPGERPAVKPKLQRSDPERFRDLTEPAAFAVGKTFARAIERWEIEHRSDPSVDSGRAVRPHMRRAHSHLYWTGEGRKQPRVRFLLPISVRGGKLIEEPEIRITEAR